MLLFPWDLGVFMRDWSWMQSWLLGYEPLVEMDLNALPSSSFLDCSPQKSWYTSTKTISTICWAAFLSFELTGQPTNNTFTAPLQAVSRSFQSDGCPVGGLHPHRSWKREFEWSILFICDFMFESMQILCIYYTIYIYYTYIYIYIILLRYESYPLLKSLAAQVLGSGVLVKS